MWVLQFEIRAFDQSKMDLTLDNGNGHNSFMLCMQFCPGNVASILILQACVQQALAAAQQIR